MKSIAAVKITQTMTEGQKNLISGDLTFIAFCLARGCRLVKRSGSGPFFQAELSGGDPQELLQFYEAHLKLFQMQSKPHSARADQDHNLYPGIKSGAAFLLDHHQSYSHWQGEGGFL